VLKLYYLDSGVYADFDADGFIDLLIPVYRNKDYNNAEYILIYSKKKGAGEEEDERNRENVRGRGRKKKIEVQ
jgi:hypothetical protein